MTPEERKRRYIWQARRGMKEVEFVLNGYLERFYDQDPPEKQALFGRLLECQDADLFEWFTHRSEPQDAELHDFIREILQRLAH